MESKNSKLIHNDLESLLDIEKFLNEEKNLISIFKMENDKKIELYKENNEKYDDDEINLLYIENQVKINDDEDLEFDIYITKDSDLYFYSGEENVDKNLKICYMFSIFKKYLPISPDFTKVHYQLDDQMNKRTICIKRRFVNTIDKSGNKCYRLPNKDDDEKDIHQVEIFSKLSGNIYMDLKTYNFLLELGGFYKVDIHESIKNYLDLKQYIIIEKKKVDQDDLKKMLEEKSKIVKDVYKLINKTS